MRVRIQRVPVEKEVDGVDVSAVEPGAVVEFSASVGSWLIAEGYAAPEMRANRSDTLMPSSYNKSSGDDLSTPRRRRGESS